MGMRPKQKKVDTRARKQGIIKAPQNHWINKVSQMKKQVRKQRIIIKGNTQERYCQCSFMVRQTESYNSINNSGQVSKGIRLLRLS